MDKNRQNDWWVDFFDSVYGDYVLHTFSDEPIQKAVKWIINTFQIDEETVVFDQCCGKGALSIPLLNNTPKVYGIDIIPRYIEHIKSQTQTGVFEAADAFEYVTPECCDLVLNWHTSFGYSDDTNKNQKMIDNAYYSLKEDGFFVMEYINFEHVIAHFQSKIKQTALINNEQVNVIRYCSIDEQRHMLCQTWTIDKFEDWQKYGETHIYYPNQLKAMFEKAGFKDVRTFFDLTGECDSTTSNKLYILGKK